MFPMIMRNSLKEWLKFKNNSRFTDTTDEETKGQESQQASQMALRQRNLPITLIVNESVERF